MMLKCPLALFLALALLIPGTAVASELTTEQAEATYGSEVTLQFDLPQEALGGDAVVHLMRGTNVGPTPTAAGFLGLGGEIVPVLSFPASEAAPRRDFEVPRLPGALAGKRVVLAFLTERNGVVTSVSNGVIATFLTDRVLFDVPAFPPSFGFAERDSGLSNTIHAVDFAGNRGWAVGIPPSFPQGGPRNSVLFTSDRGASWQPVEVDRFRSIQFTDVQLLDGVRAFLGGNYVGRGIVYSTTDGGTSWTSQSFDHPVRALSFADEQHGYIVGNDGSFDDALPISATRDGGQTWVPQFEGASVDLWTVDAVTPTLAIAAGRTRTDRAVLARTVDGGDTWRLVDLPSPNRHWLLGSGHTPGAFPVLFAVGARGIIYRSEDQGATFERIPSGTSHDLRSVHFVTETAGWITGDHGTLLATTNGGQTWIPYDAGSTLPSNEQIILDLVPLAGTQAFAVGYNGLLLEFARLGD